MSFTRHYSLFALWMLLSCAIWACLTLSCDHPLAQVGCQMGCTFCATGTMGLKGNLSAGEILEQLVHASQITPIRNIVFMVIHWKLFCCVQFWVQSRYVNRKELPSLAPDLEVGNLQIQAGTAKCCFIVIVCVRSRSRILFTIYFWSLVLTLSAISCSGYGWTFE